MDETGPWPRVQGNSRKAARLASIVKTDLARQDVTESGEGVVESLECQLVTLMAARLTDLVINGLVKVLNEDVSLASLPQCRVSLRPHDSAGQVLDQRVVEVLERALSIRSADVVDIGVSEGSTGNGVTADTDTARVSIVSGMSGNLTHEATGPIRLKISKSIASVTEGSSSPT
jgi:hypothetical protein